MTTDEATKTLAGIYMTGDSDTRLGRAAEGHLWDAEERAAAEDWGRANDSLDAAYHALRAEPPEGGAGALGRGVHPIQVKAERLWKELVEGG